MKQFLFTLATALTLSLSQPRIITITPGENIVSIINAASEGSTVQIQAGRYFISEPLRPKSNVRLEGATGKAADVVLTGAESLTWTSLNKDNTYTSAWPYDFGFWTPPTGWPTVPDIVRRREVLWVNGTRLRQILNCAGLSLNQFCVNEADNQIVFRFDEQKETIRTVEAATRSTILSVSNVRDVRISALTFHGTASNYDSSAVTFVNSQNITVENSIFTEHNGGGLGIISTSGASASDRSQNITTRGNTYNNNGGTGYGASRIVTLSASNETANGNNWRGGYGGFTNWSAAGFKHLYLRNATYNTIETNNNQAHGFWLDTDTQAVSIVGLQSSGNTRYGLFLEAFTGSVDVATSTLSNNEIGVFSGNTSNVLLTNLTLVNNRTGILIGGDAGGRPVKDFITGANYSVPPASNWRLNRVNVIGTGAAFRHGTGNFDALRNSLSSDWNNWYREGSNTPIEILVEKLTLQQWRARTGQDLNSTSVSSLPIPQDTATPSSTPVSVTTTPTISSTPTATSTAENKTPTATAEWVTIGVFRIRAEIWIEQLVTVTPHILP